MILETILDVFFGITILGAAVVALAYFWQWYYASPTSQDQTMYFTATDGWRLAVHRYRPESASGLPVILCHGLCANRYVFDIEGAPSLAKYLRDRGRDVWVLELRGSGMSAHPGLVMSDVPYDWDFEDHLRKDLPAAIEFVMQQTSARGVHWIGHSMGGMLILAWLASNPGAPVASAIAAGSPTDFSRMSNPSYEVLLRFKWMIKRCRIFPLPFLARLVTPVAHRLPGFFLGLFHRPNVAPGVVRRAVAVVSQLTSASKLWLDFGRFLEQSSFAPPDGKPYLDGLVHDTTPVMMTAGARDGMSDPDAVTALCLQPGRFPSVKCKVMGRLSGCEEDYGHLDLVVGLRADKEVFPLWLDWLCEHDDR